MTLEDAFADIADLGATGIEILGEGNIPSYPTPTAAWIDSWHAAAGDVRTHPDQLLLLGGHQMWLDRDLTVDEAAAQLPADLRLARSSGSPRCGRSSASSRSELDPHPIWEQAVQRSLDLAAGAGRRHLPGDPQPDADQAPGDRRATSSSSSGPAPTTSS